MTQILYTAGGTESVLDLPKFVDQSTLIDARTGQVWTPSPGAIGTIFTGPDLRQAINATGSGNPASPKPGA
jgi:hypothetical protein